MMIETTPGIMDVLRDSTAAEHARAEKHGFQRALLQGAIDRPLYARWLAQMLAVHEALESAVDSGAGAEPRLRIVEVTHRHAARLRLDLDEVSGGAADEVVLPGAARLAAAIEEIGRSVPVEVLGCQYVLEGSMNGNRYIAMGVQRGLGLVPGVGDRYLNPYGERQREVWTTFRATMGGLPFSEAERAGLVRAAKIVFDGVGWISEDLMPS